MPADRPYAWVDDWWRTWVVHSGSQDAAVLVALCKECGSRMHACMQAAALTFLRSRMHVCMHTAAFNFLAAGRRWWCHSGAPSLTTDGTGSPMQSSSWTRQPWTRTPAACARSATWVATQPPTAPRSCTVGSTRPTGACCAAGNAAAPRRHKHAPQQSYDTGAIVVCRLDDDVACWRLPWQHRCSDVWGDNGRTQAPAVPARGSSGLGLAWSGSGRRGAPPCAGPLSRKCGRWLPCAPAATRAGRLPPPATPSAAPSPPSAPTTSPPPSALQRLPTSMLPSRLYPAATDTRPGAAPTCTR